MAKNPGGRNIVSAVRETLDSVVSPSVRDAILSRALAESQRGELPTEPEELGEFVQGPLQDSLVRSLGPELGMSVASELERIVAKATTLMRANAGGAGATRTYAGLRRTTGRLDPGARFWVYGRAGKPCRRCGTAIQRAKQGPYARSTYWCPMCQPPR